MHTIDTHSHIHDHYFDADRDAVLKRMRDAGVGTIAIGTTVETSQKASGLARMQDDVWACIGVHPNDSTEPFEAAVFAEMLHTKVVAVGECGLDYYRGADDTEKARQKETFMAQIEFAMQHKLPLVLHVRPSKGSVDAHNDALEILKGVGFAGTAVSHFFTAPIEVARQYWDRGYPTSFPGVITFAKDTREAVAEAPLDLILSETDSPYATPMPYRGQRNEPVYVSEVVACIARIRDTPVEVIRPALLENARRVFRLS